MENSAKKLKVELIAITHQLVKHGLMAVSLQSQRYVDEDEFSYVVPEITPVESVRTTKSAMRSQKGGEPDTERS